MATEATEAKGTRVNLNGTVTDVLYKDAVAREQLANTREQLANIGNTIYPVGAIYISTTNTSPASLFGGTWERIKDRFLLAAGNTYAAGSTGGWDTHIHKYGFQYGAYYGSISMEKDDQSGALQWGTGNPVGSIINGQAHSLVNKNVAQDTQNVDNTHYKSIADTSSASNMPPYLAVYVWKRVA